jgi:rSAM/selenodomain-associated transferase 2
VSDAAPSLSIVVPVLDEAGGIVAALTALQPLRQRGVEVVVVDGGSGDDTRALARPLADVLIVARRGRARQMNAGAAAARGGSLLFLHADTSLPDGADALVAAAVNGNDIAWGRFDVRIGGHSRWLPVIARMMNWRSRLTGIATGDQAIFVTRRAFRAAGGFPDQALMEDIALSSALRRMVAPRCLAATVVTSGRRWETRGIWRTVLLMWRLRLRYFFGADPDRLALAYGYRPRQTDDDAGR